MKIKVEVIPGAFITSIPIIKSIMHEDVYIFDETDNKYTIHKKCGGILEYQKSHYIIKG